MSPSGKNEPGGGAIGGLPQFQVPQMPAEELTDRSGKVARLRLVGHGPPLFVASVFSYLSLRLGEAPPLEIVSGLEWRQLKARYVVVQPSLLAVDPRRGWVPLAGVYSQRLMLGPAETPELDLTGLSNRPQLLIHSTDSHLALTVCRGALVSIEVSAGDLIPGASFYDQAA